MIEQKLISENEHVQNDFIQTEQALKEKLTISVKERLLVPLTLIIAVLYDRLIINRMFNDESMFLNGIGVFWLCYLIGFYVIYWHKMKREKLLWYIAACASLLCGWNIIFHTNSSNRNWEYTIINFLVIPGVLMLHAQMSALKAGKDYDLQETGQLAIAWFLGWFIKPFSGIPAMGRVVSSLVSGNERRDTVRKVAAGILFALLLLGIIIPLLSGADKVFGYYVNQLLIGFNLSNLILHTIVVLIAFTLFYSFLWNIGFGKNEKSYEGKNISIDNIISGIVLGTICTVYIIFCAVQFTYLFAKAGLPVGMTYSAYAREGFAQTVVVCAINLFIFGVFLNCGGRVLRWLLGGLLGLTGMMLLSGMLRLHLYIDAYGMTWLRLLSGWFIIYLVAVVILCGVRMFITKIPLIMVCAMILLGWYVLLGYMNPDSFIVWYNGM